MYSNDGAVQNTDTRTVTSTDGHEHTRVVNDELWSKEDLAPKADSY